MENHRLKPMVEGYSEELFNKLYEDTRQLRKTLAWGIDHRRYGVTNDIIESWFDDKFIHTFNTYCKEKEPELLKGYIISSLQTFKNRVLRAAYSKKSELYSNTIELDNEYNLINYIPDREEVSNKDLFFGLVLEFFNKELSEDAFSLFQLQLNPPPYILNRINKSNSQIPLRLVLEFFDLADIQKNVKYIRQLRKDINLTIEKAKSELNPNLAF